MLKNSQTYFKNLVVRTTQDFRSMFDNLATLLLKGLRNRSEAASKIQNVFHEGLPNGDLFNYNRSSYLEKKLPSLKNLIN